ncbi:MAG: 3-deoxy-D-manno-octulosonic acid transferase [Ignavibacteria bacterium GWA2_35_9]|nr:MAG: 3-deoxy-D-manno-octulosonic acid transferase [Ignavibacteria bacterium GWA2_35_9]OGU53090.1 MAG: 3-deoxy-D-manno-octulosonic acid transferase [Ignavibacteria bacterium GWC2_36_12]
MVKTWFLFYNVFILPPLYISLLIGSLFNSKIRTGLRGRKRIFENLIIDAASLNKPKKLIWFHSSSLGEFEQAKPIIEELKKSYDVNILVTFFSPSGYINSKKYPYADLVSYIPFDTVSNAEKFISLVKPDLAVIMRYDIWPNHIREMKRAGIRMLLVDATMKERSSRKIPLIKSFHEVLFKKITKILTVSETDANGFKGFGCTDEQLKVVGDTRFDRVYQKSLKAKQTHLIKDEVLKGKKVFVAGSTWNADEEIILPVFLKLHKFLGNIMLIIAPHEPTLLNIENIENEVGRYVETIRFSHLNNYKNEKVIIIDSIGILSTLYFYADVAFVGGGFKHNVHNVLEAAVYGIPVLFGPKIENSQEPKELQKRGSGILVRNKREAYKELRTLFNNDDLRKSKKEISLRYIEENLGATEKIIKEIFKLL